MFRLPSKFRLPELLDLLGRADHCSTALSLSLSLPDHISIKRALEDLPRLPAGSAKRVPQLYDKALGGQQSNLRTERLDLAVELSVRDVGQRVPARTSRWPRLLDRRQV